MLKRLWLDAEWAFLALLCFITGFSTLVKPETYSLRSVLAEVSPLVPQIFGAALGLGGLTVFLGIATGRMAVQRVGLVLLVPPLVLVETILILTFDRDRTWVHLTYLSFIALVVARFYKLWSVTRTVAKAVEIVQEVRERDQDGA